MATLLPVNLNQKTLLSKKVKLFLSTLFIIGSGFFSNVYSQDAFIENKGDADICFGESTSLHVLIGASIGPYTIVYEDGTNSYEITDYNSDGDDESPTYGGDAIVISPESTTVYSLVSVRDKFGTYLPVDATTQTITVHPLPTNLTLTSPLSSVCSGVDFNITATASEEDRIEIWDSPKTGKIANLPYVGNINSDTQFTLVAVSDQACTIEQAISIAIDNENPIAICKDIDVFLDATGNASIVAADLDNSSTDNCGITNRTLSQSAFTCSDLGANNITLTVLDSEENSNSCISVVTVKDNIDPVINGAATSESVPTSNLSCNYSIPDNRYDPTVLTDNCAISLLTYKINGGSSVGTDNTTSLNGVSLNKGANNIVWTAEDASGNSSEWSFTITVNDETLPLFSNCPENQNLAMANNTCDATLPDYKTLLSVVAIDNCSSDINITYNQSPSAGTLISGGHGSVQNVTITAEDESGNVGTCSFQVTLVDSQEPNIVDLPANITVNNDNGTCGAVVNWAAPISSDNCTGHGIAQTSGAISGSVFPIGETSITYTATDAAGLTKIESFTITVTDTQNPVIVNLPENISQSNDIGVCGATINWTEPTFTDNCPGGSIIQTAGLANGSVFPIGESTVSYTASDAAGLTKIESFTVNITDTEDPVIVSLPVNIDVNNDSGVCGAVVTWTAPTVTDNCSGQSINQSEGLTSGSVFPVGLSTISYTATDAASNSVVESFTITVNDNEKPIISNCPSDVIRTSDAGVCTANVSWTEPLVTDNCSSGSNIVWTKSHNPGDEFSVGETIVIYTATDEKGNVSDACSFTVTVTDNQKPIISNCPEDITLNTNSGSCDAVATWTEPTGTDNCSGTLTWNKSHSSGSSFPTGNTTVTYTLSDEAGNTSSVCSFIVSVTDNVDPNAECKPATIYLNESGIANLLPSDVNNNSSDNCTEDENLIMSLSKTSFSCSEIGVNTVTLTVKDAQGNVSTCNANVTVADNTAPTITATSGTISKSVNTDSGDCFYTVNGAEFDPIVSDNCGGEIFSYVVSGATDLNGDGSLASQQLNKGDNLISWTAKDESNNVTAIPLTFTITVVDNQAPIISATTNKNRGTDTNCGYTAKNGEFDVTVTDNCILSTQNYSINGGSAVDATTLNGIVFPTGTNRVVWSASDGVNSSTRTFQITVVDDDAPIITQIEDIVQNVDAGKCEAVVTWEEPSYSDNCSGVSMTQIQGPASGTVFLPGITHIKYRATDAVGLVTDMVFNVTVADQTAPDINCPASAEVSPFVRAADNAVCFYTVQGSEFNPVVTDECNLILTNSFDGTSTLEGKQIPTGVHEIVWTASDGINSSTCSVYIKIEDNQDPTYSQPTGDPLNSYSYSFDTDPGQCYYTISGTDFDLGNVADNCDTEIPSYVITKNGVEVFTGNNTLANLQLPKDNDHPYSIVWTLSDVNSNTIVSTSFNITISDNQAPSFVCYGNEVREIPDDACEYIINGTEFDPTDLLDNCDNANDLTLSYTLNGVSGGASTSVAGVTLASGVHDVVWTVTDQSGNSETCSFEITVTDLTSPVITSIANQSKDAPVDKCSYKTVGTEFDPTATDNCTTLTLINNQNNSATLANFEFPVGVTIVVWKATDAAGNITTMQYQVSVNDIAKPTYTLSASESRSASVSNCYYSAVGNEFDPQSIVDNCTPDNFSITNNWNGYKTLAYEQFPVGETIVEWTVADYFGNEEKKTITITVVDDTDPVINCPTNDYLRVVDQGKTYYTVGSSEFKPVASDNCTYTYTNNITGTSILTGEQLTPGDHSIVWTAEDAAGNISTCTVIVTIVNDLYPAITCVGDQSVSNTTGQCSYTTLGTEFDASSTTTGATLENNYNNSSSLAGAVFPQGTTLVTWTASRTIDGDNYTNSCSFYVTVRDDEFPTITAPADVTVNTNAGCYASGVDLGTPTISDNCGIDWTRNDASARYYIGEHTVTWRVRDLHGNISTATQKVTVVDDDAPYIDCPSPNDLCRQVDDGQMYYTVNGSEFGPYHNSDCSGIKSVVNDFNGTSSLNGAQILAGVNTIVWTVTDNVDNVSTCTITVTINNDDPPSVTCRENARVNTDSGVCTYTVTGTGLDVSSPATLTHNIQTTNSGITPYAPNVNTLAGAIFPKGVTDIIWTATDGSDVNNCCTFTITVIDNQPPSVSWPADVTANVDTGSCTATGVVLGTPSGTDNCDAPLDIVYTRDPSENNFDAGVTNVYWTARDSRGFVVYHTQKVTVVDDISPIITCPTETYYREFNNSQVSYYTIVGTEFKPAVSDNCNVTSYTNDKNNSGNLNGVHLSIGDHEIAWTATDISSNTDNCTMNVTIVDSFDPILDCPSNLYEHTASDACSYTNSGSNLDAQITNLSIISGRTLVHNVQTTDSGILPYASSNTTLDGAVFPKGTSTITWTARQTIGGNEYSSTCAHQVTITDNVAPVINPLPSDITVNIDPNTCISTTVLSNPIVTDNCTATNDLIISNDAPSPFLIGTTKVRWTIRDEAGNTTVHNQNVTVVDNEGPVISNCSSTITVEASGENCQSIANWPALVATDGCSGVKSFTSTHSPGSLFDVGTTAVSYTAIDNNDNESTCTFNVVVTDVNPTISCIADQTRNTNPGICSYQVLGNEFDPTAYSDNCKIASVVWSFIDAESGLERTGSNTLSGVEIPRGFGAGATGETLITWTVTDANGNETSCSFLLTIEDHEAPVIAVPGNQTRSTDFHKNYYTAQGTEFDDVTSNDNCGIVTKLVNEFSVSSLAGTQLHMGENTITWFAEDDKGNRSEAKFYAYVVDTEVPYLNTAPANTIAQTSGTCDAVVNYTAPTFLDNVTAEGDITLTVSPADAGPGGTFAVGTTEVTYMAVDEEGNQFTYTFNITVEDNEDPTITCPSGSPFNRNTDTGESYYLAQGTEFNPSFDDNCSATISNNYNNSNTLANATFPVGSTDVIWTATDDSGNFITCTIQVVISDNEAPVIANCPNATVAKNADIGACSFEVPGAEDDPYGFTDNNGLKKLTYQIGSDSEVGADLTTTLAGVMIPVGTIAESTTTVTWRLYDLSDNVSATCETVFTISDVENPTITTVANQVRNTDSGQGYYTSQAADNWNPVVTDNCDVEKITYNIGGAGEVGTDLTTNIEGVQFAIGTHEVVWSATDIHGNTNTGRYLVKVIDEENPTVNCNTITVQLDADGNYTLDTDDINSLASGSSDPSGIATIEVTPNSFSCNDVGNNTVLVTVTDNHGNISTCNTAVVILQDATPPNVICNDITIQLDVLGQASILSSQLDGGSTDACGIQSVNAAQTTFDCSDVGANIVEVTVTDINGNSSTCNATVTVQDNVDPNAVCNPITIYLDASGNYSLSETDIDNLSSGSSDNCNLIKMITPSSFDCNDIGTNATTLRVTDPQGNYDECTTTVTVVDNTNPTAICQDIIVQLDADGNASITPDQINDGSTDNCTNSENLVLSLDKSNFDCFNIGGNLITLTVTDEYGNSSTCTATVTVQDKVPPIVVCQDITLQLDASGNASIIPSQIDNGSNDNCTSITSDNLSLDKSSFTCNDIGEQTVILTVVDEHLNSASCTAKVTVEDNTVPNAICQNITVQLDGDGNVSVEASDIDNGSNDACGIATRTIDISTFNCSNVGDNSVILTVTDNNGNSSNCTATVTVEDPIDPNTICTPLTVYLDNNGDYSLTATDIDNLSLGSTDNCDLIKTVTPNSFDCSNIGANTVTLRVTGPNGKYDECTTTITVVDNIDPVANCKNITVQLDATGNVTITPDQINDLSTDNCTNITSANLSLSKTSFDCFNIGSNTVTLTVTDAQGNNSSCTATVIVEDKIAPNAICQNITIQLDAAGNASITPAQINNGSTDNCTNIAAPNLSLDNASFTCADLGDQTVTLTVSDDNGNSSTCDATVTVQDIIDPTALCKDFTVSLNRQGLAAVSASQIDNGSSDNCSFTMEISKLESSGYVPFVTYNCADPASQTVWLKVTDAAGNSTTCSSTLTIKDEQAPTLDDLSDREVVVDNSVCTYTHVGSDWNPTDNCDSSPTITYTVSAPSTLTGSNVTLDGQVFEKGITTVTWTTLDASGNTRNDVIFDVIVSDDQAPEFLSCPSNISKLAASGETFVTINDIPVSTYDDNCAVVQFDWSLTGATAGNGSVNNPINGTTNPLNEANASLGTNYNIGTTTVNYNAIDAAGNSVLCAFTITVNASGESIIANKTNITTTEDLDYEEFTVVLKSKPTGTVVLDVVSDDIGEGVVDKSQLTFDTDNWDQAQTIRVTGVNDDIDDDDINYNVSLSINKIGTDDDSGYEQAQSTVVAAVNQDNDAAGVTVTVNDAITGEDGSTGSFDVVLDTEPTQNVSITLLSDDTTEGSISGSTTLTFTPLDWNSPQTVIVNGEDDDIDDGDVAYNIITGNTTSTDPKYIGVLVDDVSMNNADNDTAGFVVIPNILSTNESGTTASFTVKLTSKPATDDDNYIVVVDVVSQDTGEGTVDKDQLIFNHSNWNDNQTVTVTGIDELVVDGDTSYDIALTVDTETVIDADETSDSNYSSLNPIDVTVKNDDNDAATLSIDDVSAVETNSGTTDFEFTVTRSGAEVVGSYQVSYYTQNGTAKSPSDYTAIGGLLTFNGSDTEKTLTLQVNGDVALEPDEDFELVLGNVIHSGRDITINPAGKTGTGTIENDDSSELSISNPSITEGDSGVKQLVFDVTLSNPVELGVTVDYTTADGTATTANSDYTSTAGTLNFVGTAAEVQTISVPINGDEIVELDESFSVNLSNARINGEINSFIGISDTEGVGTGTITNDDDAVISISGFTVDESTSSANFTITMDKVVQDAFTIDFATSDNTALDGNDYTEVIKTGGTALSFGAANALSQTVSVSILDGSIVEPIESFYGKVSNKVDAKNQSVIFFGGGASTQAEGIITDNDVATLAINDMSVAESAGTATFTVTLSGTVQNDFTLNYSTADNTAELTSDYNAISITELTFGGLNNNVQTFTVDIIENSIAEASETYYINLSDLNINSQSGVSISDNQGLGTITDNDIVNLVLNGFIVTETDGSQVQNFFVSRDIASQSPIALLFSTIENTAKNASDFTAQTNAAITLIANSTANTNIPTTILGDAIAEPTEDFSGTISLNGVNGQQVNITTASTTSTINDNDVMQVTLEDKTVTETDGTQSVNYVVSTNIEAEKDIVLEFKTSDGTAITTSDYTGQANTVVTIPAGSKSVNIPVNVLGDVILEPQEVFNGAITLTNNNSQQVTIADANAVYTIDDNDAASIAIADVSVAENIAGGLATFTVILTGNIQDEFSVDYTASDNASALDGSDYTLSSGTLTFPAGSVSGTTKTFTVAITDDNIVEPTETYTVTLSGITGGLATISDGTAVGTITDNEAASVAINDVSVAENVAAGEAVFTVTLTGNIQDALTVDFTTNDVTAHAPSDYTAVTNTLTFAGGSLSGATQSIAIPIIDNNIAESTETYNVNLSNVVCTGSASISDNQGLGTITDDDEVTAINLAGFTNSETDANVSYNFVASMDIVAQYPVVISFTTTEGTAIAGSDFTAQSVVEYTILPGNLSVNIPVEVIGDLVNEPQETFTGTIAIVNKNGQQIALGTDTATGTINDNDTAIVSITGFTVNESIGTADFTITLNRSVQNVISVDFETADRTAIAGSDYTAVSTTTLNFGAANANTQTVTVLLTNDDIVEPSETITGRLSNLVKNSQDVSLTGGGVSTDATGTITDNDLATLAIDDISVNESAGTATFTVTQTGTVQNDYAVDYSTANSSAVEPSDYTAISTTTFTFGGSNSSAQTITVDIIENAIAEPTEEYNINLTNLIRNGQSGVSISKAQGIGTITDNDAYTISIADITVSETDADANHNFVATMNGTAQEDVVISFTTTNGSADATDFTAQTAQLYTIPAGSTTVDIPVAILGDDIAEAQESFTVAITISNANAQQVTIGTGSATATINDDDAYTISIADITVSETDVNANHNFVATMSGEAQEDIVISFTTTNGSANATDFIAQIAQLYTIPAGSTSVNIPVEVIGDVTVESTENFTAAITISNANAQQVTIGAGDATATINDDDASEVSIAVTTSASEPGTNGLFTLTLSNPIDVDTEITYSVGGTAIEGTDYSNLGTTVTIPANSTEATISVNVIDDALVETGSESIVVTLSLTDNAATVSSSNSANMNLGDDDSTEVSIAATDDTAQEGTPATNNAEFTISLSKASAVATVVSYTVSGTATEGNDFTSLSGTITISAGSKTSTIDILALDDILFEDTETVIVNLTGITSGDATTVLGTPVSATATIIDNDIECFAGNDAEICSSDVDYTLSDATQNNASTYNWSTSGSGTFTDASILNAVYNPSDDDRANGEVQLTLNVSGISGTDNDVMTLKIWQAVVIDAGVETALINEGETYSVSGASAENYAAITWTSAGGTFDDANALNPVFTPTTTDNVVIRMTATGLGTGACSDAYDEISITINDFPTASNENVTGLEDQELSFTESDFSANYSDAEGDVFAGVKIVSTESVGDLEYDGSDVNSGLEILSSDISKLKFNSLVNENGVNYDSFEFKVFDGIAYSSETYIMTISITEVNDEPSLSLMNPKDIWVSEDIGDVIINGQVASQTSGPTNEASQVLSLHLANDNPTLFSDQPTLDATGNLTFTPANNVFGMATLSVYISDDGGVANDGDDTSEIQTFTITVEAVNDSPIAEDDLFTMNEDTQLIGDVKLDNGNGSDSDPDNTPDNFTYTLIDGGSANSYGSLVFNANGTFTFDPNPDFFGEVSFTYQVCDNPIAPLVQKCDEAIVTITVNQVSDTPLAVDDNLWLKEDASISGNVFDNDERLVDIPVVVLTNTNPANGVLSINSDGTFTYTPNTGYFGNDSFDYTLQDIDGDESTATVYIVVDPLDYDPIANDDFDTINEEEISTGDLFANDEDFINDPVVVVSNTEPSNGTVIVNADGTYTYRPNVDFYGIDTFTYTLEDSDGDQDTATVTITVNPVNDIPVAVNDSNTTTEDTEVGGNVLVNDTNLGDAPVSVTDFTDPQNGTVLVVGDGTYTYRPNEHFNGTDSFTYTIEDENGDASTATVTILVTPVNDIPVAIDDSNSTDEKSSVSGNVLTNDTDSDLDALTVLEINGEPALLGAEVEISNGGIIQLNANGTYDFNPNGDFNYLHTGETTQVTFTYSMTDGIADSNIATVTITIIGVNDAPIANDDQVDTYDNEEIIISVLDNDVDADGDKLSVDVVDEPTYGDVVVNEDGTISYIADLGSYCNTDQFSYRVCDPAGLCDIATVTIEIGVLDADEDSIPDAVETLTLNTDGDADLNYQDLDSDNDGISDEIEAQISDSCTDLPVDTDGDGTPDYLDTDSDNDGFTDEEEGDDDCDGDGKADYIDEYDDCAEYVSIPEGFSPNGDGINDKFVIKGIKDFPNSKLMIFNRWGNEIFKARGYQNDWDGRAENSMTVGTEIVPEGTYYYVIDLGNGSKVIKGYVYINY